MKIKILLLLVSFLIVLAGCDQVGVKSEAPREVLISKGFVDDNTYRIVCRGYPLEGLTGIQKGESSKRAALLNAYYFIQNEFNESVAPDKDGTTEKIEIMNDHAVLYYVVHKKGLKKMVKPEKKTENRSDNKTE